MAGRDRIRPRTFVPRVIVASSPEVVATVALDPCREFARDEALLVREYEVRSSLRVGRCPSKPSSCCVSSVSSSVSCVSSSVYASLPRKTLFLSPAFCGDASRLLSFPLGKDMAELIFSGESEIRRIRESQAFIYTGHGLVAVIRAQAESGAGVPSNSRDSALFLHDLEEQTGDALDNASLRPTKALSAIYVFVAVGDDAP